MFHRIIKPSKTNSFFLFGARGTGKSTFIEKQFQPKNCWSINLLDADLEDQFSKDPNLLLRQYKAHKKKPEWVFIDEVQRVPKILDLVHKLIEEEKQKFILTGSSARKLKRGAANLLAGRAFVYNLFPLTHNELGNKFDLDFYLQWGGLPKIYDFKESVDRKTFLRSYALTYLTEEVRQEQLVRDLDPFREFLTVAAQSSGKLINFSNIARDVGVDYKTVQSYFQILEDTWLGFWLPSFHRSIRKSQKQTPKFYLFDIGIKHSLAGEVETKPTPGNSFYGDSFEHFVIGEVFKLNTYTMSDFRMSFYLTKHGVEIDLILSKANLLFLVEIKSADKVNGVQAKKLQEHGETFPRNKRYFFVSRDPVKQKIGDVLCLHWRDFLTEIFKS